MKQAGDQIDYFKLLSRLGRNGFGEVWTAREGITNRLLRITFLESTDEYQIARFRRAVALHALLNHPSLIAYTGQGFHQEQPFQATEHVQGPTLGTLVAQGGRMEESKVLQIVVQVAAGLDHAWNAARIVHRNLTPDTILVDLASIQDGQSIRVKIIDFGYALGRRAVDSHDPEAVEIEEEFQRLAQQEAAGTVMTMSPEQVRRKELSCSSDMYALGVICYLLLTGKPPFTGTDEQVRNAHLRTSPHQLGQLVPGLKPDTASLVRRLLNKSPEGRFPDWEGLRQRAQEMLDQRRPRTTRITSSTSRIVAADRGGARPDTTRITGKTGGFTTDGFAYGLQSDAPAPPRPASSVGTPTQGHALVPNRIPAVPAVPVPPGTVAPHGPSAGTARLSGERVLLGALADRLRTAGLPPAGTVVAATTQPTIVAPDIDDGLTPEQRGAIWMFLFNTPAIQGASLQAPAGAPVSEPTPGPSLAVPASGEPPMPVVPSRQAEPEAAAEAEPDEDPFASPDDGTDAPAFADLLKTVDAPAAVQDPAADQTAEVEVARNPVQSLHWKQALELLRGAIVGKVRYQAGPESATRRITKSLRMLVAGRARKLEEVAELIALGRFDAADALLDQISGPPGEDITTHDAETSLLRARSFALRGDFASTQRWAQNAVLLGTTQPEALALVAFSHLHARRATTAMAVFDEAARVHPESPLGPFGQATILFLAGLDTAAGELLAATREQHGFAPLVQLQALRCRAHGDVEGEVAALQELSELSPDDWDLKQRIKELVDGGGPATGSYSRR